MYEIFFLVGLFFLDFVSIGVIPRILGIRESARELKNEGILAKFICGVTTNYKEGCVSKNYYSGKGTIFCVTKKSIAVQRNMLTFDFKVPIENIISLHGESYLKLGYILSMEFSCNKLELCTLKAYINRRDGEKIINIINGVKGQLKPIQV